MVALVAVGLVVGGLFLVYLETQAAVSTGIRRPGLRVIGWILVTIGGLCLLGLVTGG